MPQQTLSPMMQQYFQIKEQYKDTLVFFRVGDFYEMFYDDALTASKELELTLTGKDCGDKKRAPMCGVPFHSCDTYIARLVAKGYKVGICEQLEDPSKAKGLVKRDIIRVVTPGTVMEPEMLDDGSNNFICVIYTVETRTGFAFCDISTGELYAAAVEGEPLISKVKDELLRFSPREILVGGDTVELQGLGSFIKERLNACVNMLTDDKFDTDYCRKLVCSHFHAENLESIGFEEEMLLPAAVGALLQYLQVTQISGLERISKIEFYNQDKFMHIDYNTRRNLELTEPVTSKNKKASLLAVLDMTKTAMGKRLIKSYIEKPLMYMPEILRRQNAVAELVDDVELRMDLRERLNGMYDMERIMTRVVYGSANARELRSLCAAMKKLPLVKERLAAVQSALLRELYQNIDVMADITELIDNTIVDDPPFSVREGGIIKDGCHAELDELHYDMTNSAELMAGIEARERERTNIPKLKVGYNRVFGYYIEVSNSYKNMVPDDYIRKQTLTGGERFITQELKELEKRILGAKDRTYELEYELFDTVRKTVAQALDRITQSAKAIAATDVLVSLAQAAFDYNYCRPIITMDGVIKLKDSRHPVVERIACDGSFVPNDVLLDNNDNRVAIITGPNMAGKSTYMRQVALIVLMAQMGSFVPAKSAEISITDSIFTRIGASDDLSSGQSTFMVEMNEVAQILKNATANSLLVLDEIGRGTSTFDGMSIARAVLEYVADKKTLGAKTLFATHYHELTSLEKAVDGIRNYNIAVIKKGDDITFLRRIVAGAADDSYGVEVAKLAGIPDIVIQRAKQILKELEKNGKTTVVQKSRRKQSLEEPQQIILDQTVSPIISRLKSLDINKLTPMESMNVLFELIKLSQDS